MVVYYLSMVSLMVGIMIGVYVIAFLYILPFIIALSRKHIDADAIGILIAVFGWTILGWIIALIWACYGTNISKE